MPLEAYGEMPFCLILVGLLVKKKSYGLTGARKVSMVFTPPSAHCISPFPRYRGTETPTA